MKRWIIGSLTLLTMTGCNMPSVDEGRVDAYKRWYNARARVLYSVAVEHLKVGQLDLARTKAQEALALEDGFVQARILLAKVYLEQGHYSAAVAELQEVRQQVPKSDEAVYLLGVAQEKSGLFEAAVKSYRSAHALNSNNADAVLAAAEALVAMGRIREAQLQLESYTSALSDNPAMYELAGRLAIMRKEYQQASEYYEQACDLDPENLRYREALGGAQFFAGRHAHAVETFKRLTELKDYEVAAWVYTMLGDCYLAITRPFDARDAYELASQRKPESAGVWINLSKAALALDDLPRAILSAQQALSLEAGRLDAKLLLGYALLRDGQINQALKFLGRAVARHPENGTLQCLLGRAHAAVGDAAAAARCYVSAIKLEPDNELVRELLSGRQGKKDLRIE